MTSQSHVLRTVIDDPRTTRLITGLILLNAVTLGLETNAALVQQYGQVLSVIDRVLLTIFTAELAIKIAAYRRDFIKSGWNWFDLIIITISWLPSTGVLSVLRALRVLRVLRLLSVVPQMR
ncbi:MAG: ion transporter, partial [Gammaproteobacteria bacterium]|nr:ion transporter [Gammaproteobacteria bacterium]